MYHLLSGLYAEWTRKEQFNILILGLQSVGKTSVLEKVKSIYLRTPPPSPQRITPTVGQNVFNLSLPSSNLHFWDLGGSKSVRSLWQKYFEESHALVWVVDARLWDDLARGDENPTIGYSAYDKIKKGKGKANYDDDQAMSEQREESWTTLAGLMAHPSLEGLPVLILANKVDDASSSSLSTSFPADHARNPKHIKSWFQARMEGLVEKDIDIDSRDDISRRARRNGYWTTSSPLDKEENLNGDKGYEWEVIGTSAIDG
ncbi:P-loop containing nucleoside triphosphate hydrolase protein [Violaceomyces palustris]|uniref:P-loop containing nucleoside triphosphate hydrolase protein n=1 Tax=Violaceomyces palustris TaxID=1673888 RepID=A0ACD0NMR3_9BASI|nr:P-loop containing nucleoside triphosphate hydrolase protein [Violaceomyces palustris]